MWYRGEYFAVDNLGDAITQYNLRRWNTRTRGQRIGRRIFTILFLSPWIAMFGFMGILGAEYAIHLIAG